MVAPVTTPEMAGAAAPFPVPAPHNGLNTRENYTVLQPTEASILENFLPDEGSCNVRPGHTEHQEISGATSVPTLMLFKGASAQKLIAASDGELYDVTGTPSALTTASYTLDRWSHTNYNGFLFGVNGTDTPWRYNGSAVSATGFTGVTLVNIETISQVRNRLWVTLVNSADVYYGGISSVTGALTAFQLSQIASGGKCIAINSWSRDAGDGSDDFTVFVMDTGEVIVYQGDPATSFALVGKYASPALVEADATVKIGGELVLMTVSGPVPVSAVVAGVAFSPELLKDWGKIAPSWQRDYQRYKANAGFSAHFFEGIVYFNFPTGTRATRQYIYNTRIPAWSNFSGWPAAHFANIGGILYFGSYSDGFVYRVGTGSDNGAPIATLSRQGAVYPFNGTNAGIYNSFQPYIDADGPAQIQFAMDTDFQEGKFGPIKDLNVISAGMDWGDDWGSDWASPSQTQRRWYSTKGEGAAVSPAVRTFSTANNVKWWSSRIRAMRGGQI